MKKPYSLDYTIIRDTDRLKAVEDILDKLPRTPTQRDCELFASYILYGKDENGKNSLSRRETYDSNEKRYNSYKTSEDAVQSLDAVLDPEKPCDHGAIKPFDAPRVYKKQIPYINRREDADIPGMRELWDAIERTQHVYDVSCGKEQDDSVVPVTDPYRLYQLKHQLIDMRRHQYYLKDAYKPTIRFLNVKAPSPQTVNWSEDTTYWLDEKPFLDRLRKTYLPVSRDPSDYEKRVLPDGTTQYKWVVSHSTFDWENIKHIKALIQHYGDIYQELWDKPLSWGRTLLYDFDRYFDMANLDPVREYIMLRKIDKCPYTQLQVELREKFDVDFSLNHISAIAIDQIPLAMLNAIKRHRIMLETPPEEMKRCSYCHKHFPPHLMFFSSHAAHRDGLSTRCKDCEHLRYANKVRGGDKIDRRLKVPHVSKMSSAEDYGIV